MALSYLQSWLVGSLQLFLLMAPYLLLGFFLAGVLHVAVPQHWIVRHLGGHGFRAALKAALIGTPLPLCSCGVIPFADLLKRRGASRPAITSFLISTPQTGIDSFLASYAILGLPIALWKVLTAFVSGVIGGTVLSLLEPLRAVNVPISGDAPVIEEASPARASFSAKGRSALSYGLGMLVEDIAGWLVLGTLIGGAISVFMPDEFLTRTFPNPYLQMLAVLLVAVPLYVCATGSLPVAAALVLKGLPLGGAIVFLIAGPATNAATLSVFIKVLGRRVVAVYLTTIVVTSYLSGLLFQQFFPHARLPVSLQQDPSHGGHLEMAGALSQAQWWEWGTALLLGALVLRALGIKLRHRREARGSRGLAQKETADMETACFNVKGMSCGHCTSSVERAIRSIEGVADVSISLEDGRAIVKGHALSDEVLMAAIKSAGYEASPAPC
ncbi:MAG: permease [Candidatus Eisenbacteria bacterium]|uniref:Permease n=1 Tax=Eiseniibacteriota bacterium TaxID=2212470 RepID=A0A948RVI0_UNCEI|nr:permease [Candidatus Eisenbacteria bacterium]MBU1948859.1 permease [Candidatus Eisenbacteria bacterium]MBU2691281.1 permease [Candidatus Eisenbacteria bacterium]